MSGCLSNSQPQTVNIMLFGQAEAGLRMAVKKAEAAAAAAAKEYADSFHQEAHRNWIPHWLDERINEVRFPYPAASGSLRYSLEHLLLHKQFFSVRTLTPQSVIWPLPALD